MQMRDGGRFARTPTRLAGRKDTYGHKTPGRCQTEANQVRDLLRVPTGGAWIGYLLHFQAQTGGAFRRMGHHLAWNGEAGSDAGRRQGYRYSEAAGHRVY